MIRSSCVLLLFVVAVSTTVPFVYQPTSTRSAHVMYDQVGCKTVVHGDLSTCSDDGYNFLYASSGTFSPGSSITLEYANLTVTSATSRVIVGAQDLEGINLLVTAFVYVIQYGMFVTIDGNGVRVYSGSGFAPVCYGGVGSTFGCGSYGSTALCDASGCNFENSYFGTFSYVLQSPSTVHYLLAQGIGPSATITASVGGGGGNNSPTSSSLTSSSLSANCKFTVAPYTTDGRACHCDKPCFAGAVALYAGGHSLNVSMASGEAYILVQNGTSFNSSIDFDYHVTIKGILFNITGDSVLDSCVAKLTNGKVSCVTLQHTTLEVSASPIGTELCLTVVKANGVSSSMCNPSQDKVRFFMTTSMAVAGQFVLVGSTSGL